MGKLFDQNGQPMVPTFSVGRNGKRYRYYVSEVLQTGAAGSTRGAPRRIPGAELDQLVGELTDRMTSPEEAVLNSVAVKEAGLELSFRPPPQMDPTEWRHILGLVSSRLKAGERAWSGRGKSLNVLTPVSVMFRGGRTWVEGHQPRTANRADPALVAALRRGHDIVSSIGLPLAGPSAREARAITSTYERALAPLAFLAPDIQQAILEGRHPRSLTLSTLQTAGIPLNWADQRQAFGFGPGLR